MAVGNYAGAAMAKGALAVLGKVSVATFALTLGTVVVVAAVVAGAMLVGQMADFGILDSEVSDEAKCRKGQM